MALALARHGTGPKWHWPDMPEPKPEPILRRDRLTETCLCRGCAGRGNAREVQREGRRHQGRDAAQNSDGDGAERRARAREHPLVGEGAGIAGRQLDGAQSSIEALPAIVNAVGSQIEVHMDGGIRSGQDVLKAIALGAKGTYIGRSFLYGLGANGREGVDQALQIIHKELDLTMAFCGRTQISQVNSDILLPSTFPT